MTKIFLYLAARMAEVDSQRALGLAAMAWVPVIQGSMGWQAAMGVTVASLVHVLLPSADTPQPVA